MAGIRHSILIPHRNRHQYLGLCLWSIHRSAVVCEVREYEVVIADSGSAYPLTDELIRFCEDDQNGLFGDSSGTTVHLRALTDPAPPRVFSKPRALNQAIDAARGDILTFLDADAIVGRLFMETPAQLDADAALVRVNYRVRYLPATKLWPIQRASNREIYVAKLFATYDEQPIGWEAYRNHYQNVWSPSEQPWGNSQFTIRRQDLRGARPDEAYFGRGQEDMDFNCQIEAAWDEAYRGVIYTDPDHAMFHLQHEYERGWNSDRLKYENNQRYRAKRLKLMGV